MKEHKNFWQTIMSLFRNSPDKKTASGEIETYSEAIAEADSELVHGVDYCCGSCDK